VSRIAQRFNQLHSQGRTALVPYVTAGDPEPGATVPLMHAMVAAGADIIELGVPFSDPMADGPVIQKATERALAHGVSLTHVLEMVAEFRRQDPETPVVLMGYLNPIEVMGYAHFARAAAKAGVDGVLTVDLPPEEAAEVLDEFRRAQLDPIFLLAPTTDDQRVRTIAEAAGGFVYYVSLKGVTGAGNLDIAGVHERVRQLREIISIPVGVGFGIKDAASAAQVGEFADAVVVGSALVTQIEKHATSPAAGRQAVSELLSEMRQALDKGRHLKQAADS
jgi:tryptophan synthase alpha chain